MHNDHLLSTSLSVAVPLWIAQIQKEGWSWEKILEVASRCGQTVASEGDNILYRSKKKGGTAKAFNDLALGMACLAFVPGGVTAFGMHFEAKLEQ